MKKSVEETAVKLYSEMSMDAKLIGKFITQQVAAAMDREKNSMKKIKKLEKGGKDGVSGESVKK